MSSVHPWTPLGLALAACHAGRHEAELVISSDLWEDDHVPVREYYRPADEHLPAVERRALEECRGRVLDYGAGAGRHALELQARGVEVVALDVCPEAVAVMRDRGVRDARLGDLDRVVGERFDTVLMMMHGLGIVGDRRGLRRFLAWVPDLVGGRGCVLADSADLAPMLTGSGFDERTARMTARRPVRFRLAFDGVKGRPYRWFFVPPGLLDAEARAAGLEMDIVATGDRGTYLARLSVGGAAQGHESGAAAE